MQAKRLAANDQNQK